MEEERRITDRAEGAREGSGSGSKTSKITLRERTEWRETPTTLKFDLLAIARIALKCFICIEELSNAKLSTGSTNMCDHGQPKGHLNFLPESNLAK